MRRSFFLIVLLIQVFLTSFSYANPDREKDKLIQSRKKNFEVMQRCSTNPTVTPTPICWVIKLFVVHDGLGFLSDVLWWSKKM
jgi:hypothetical protein